MKARKKLEQDEEDAERALEEAMARLARVRKMKRKLKEEGDRLFVRGMQSLEEQGTSVFDQVESSTVSEVQSQGAFDIVDWNSVFTDVPFNDPSWLDSVDDNSSGVVGH